MQQQSNEHIENDKRYAPYLFAASFQDLVKFAGSHQDHGKLYWHFSPKNKAETLISQFHSKTAPHIPPLDLFEAIETFWRQVSIARKGGGFS